MTNDDLDPTVLARLRELLSESTELDGSAIADNADLYAAGLQSAESVQLLFRIEDAFGVEIPDELVNRSLMSTLETLSLTVTNLIRAAL